MGKEKRERVLTSTIETYSRRINLLQGDITTLQERQYKIEADLAAKRAELSRIQQDLRKERARLTRLRARLAESRAALSARLVHLFKADEPDMVTVVLESNGFEDLLQRSVDVVPKDGLNPVIRKAVLDSARVIYAK